MKITTHRKNRQDKARRGASCVTELYASKIQKAANGSGRGVGRQTSREEKVVAQGTSKSMAKSMSEKELKKMTGTKRKSLPKKKKQK